MNGLPDTLLLQLEGRQQQLLLLDRAAVEERRELPKAGAQGDLLPYGVVIHRDLVRCAAGAPPQDLPAGFFAWPEWGLVHE